DPEVATIVAQAARAFQELGAVEDVKCGFADSHRIIRLLWNAHEAGNYARYLPEFRSRMDPGLVASLEDGVRYSVTEYVEARGDKLAYCDSVRPLFETYDLLLTPSVSVTAFEVGRPHPSPCAQHARERVPGAGMRYA